MAPAVSKAVAEALAERWCELPAEAVSVILDLDPEVYRLGYGDPAALTLLEDVARRRARALNRHPGIRIGVLIVDDLTIAYSPTPLLIEAGPRRSETPNAVVLGPPPAGVAAELGVGLRGLAERTVGLDRVETGQIEQVRADLDRNPPRKFDVARTERVFNAHFEFVEFELAGTAVERREVSIPSELMGLAADQETERLLRTSFRLVDEDDALSGKALQQAKAQIVAAFLKPLKGYGNAVLRSDRPRFEQEVEQLKKAVAKFKETVREKLQAALERNRGALKKALLPRLLESPPRGWTRADGSKADSDLIERWLDRDLRRAFGSVGRLVGEMKVRVVFKGVTYDLLMDPQFVELAKRAMPTLGALHAEWDAARAAPP